MKLVTQIIKEQFIHLRLIFQLSIYDIKGKYSQHYLGVLWQFLNPFIQISIYWLIFGLGFRKGHPVDDVPYFLWLVVGLIPWFFITPSILQGSNSIYAKVNLVSKMKFPVSVLPTVSIVSNTFNFLVMLILMGIILVVNKVNPGMYLIQLPYYLLCLYVFLFSVTLLFSTISVLVRDFQLMLQSMIRMIFYVTPILWVPGDLPNIIEQILKLNPVYYLIVGFRYTFLEKTWFFEDMAYTYYFWITSLLILFVGAVVHTKFKNKFVDYL